MSALARPTCAFFESTSNIVSEAQVRCMGTGTCHKLRNSQCLLWVGSGHCLSYSVCMTILIATLLAGTPIPPQLEPSWAEFSRSPTAPITKTKVEVGTLGFDQGRQQLDFWLRRTVKTGVQQREEVTWADTRTCASARPLLASMRDIPVPRFAPVGSSGTPPITLDGVSYALRTYSDHGMLTAETNVGTPVAAWVDGALIALEGCWSSRVPERTR